MAFKIMDETALLYEKWKSHYSAASLCLLKFKSLDANQPEGAFETRLLLARGQMEKLAVKLEEHPYGLALLPQIYDALVEEMDLSLPIKSNATHHSQSQEKDWNLLKKYSDKCLHYENLFSEFYMRGGDSLATFSKEQPIRRIRSLILELVTASPQSSTSLHSTTEDQLVQLSNILEDSYSLNTSYCRLILYQASNILLAHVKSKESTQCARSFLNNFIKKSQGVEFLDYNLLQHIYITLLTLDSATDFCLASDNLRKAYMASKAKPFTIEHDTLMNAVGPEKIPLDILIDLSSGVPGRQAKILRSENLETALVTEEQEIGLKKTLISSVTLESLNAYIAKLEKEISASIICPYGLRYKNLLAKWRRLHQLFSQPSVPPRTSPKIRRRP